MYFTKIFLCFITFGKSDKSPSMYPTILPSLNLNNSNNPTNLPTNIPTIIQEKSKNKSGKKIPPTAENIFAGIIFCLFMGGLSLLGLYCCYNLWCVWDDILD